MVELDDPILDGWTRTKVDKNDLDKDGFTIRPFCSLCSNLIVKCPVSSPRTGKAYCSNKCMKIGDAKEGRHMDSKEKKECDCGARFDSTDELVKHKNEKLCSAFKTPDDQAVEAQASKEAKKVDIVVSLEEYHHKYPYGCDYVDAKGERCSMSYHTEKALKAHKTAAHSPNKGEHKCPKCARVFAFPGHLKNHLMKEHKMKAGDVDEVLKKAGAGSKAKPKELPDIIAIEKREKAKTSYDQPKPEVISEGATDRVIIRARTVGYACADCCLLWEPETGSRQPKHCPECGRLLISMSRRSIRI